MAGDWIKMKSDLHENTHVLEMSDALGVDILHVVGMLWRIWSWADAQSIDGNAVRVTEVTLDRLAQRVGFASALRKVGWLDGRDGLLTFPRFAEHNGQTSKARALTAKRVALFKDKKGNATVTHGALPREEKRREEVQTPRSPPRGAEVSATAKTVEKPPNRAAPTGPDGRGVPGQRAEAAAEANAENAGAGTAAGGTGGSDSVPATAFSEAGATSAQAPPEPPEKSPAKPPAKGPLQLRAEALMRRRPATPLTDGETRAFRKNKAAIEATTEDDWKALEAFYAAPQPETFARKDLATLVNNWNGEIDRARAWAAAGGRANARAGAPENKRRAAFA